MKRFIHIYLLILTSLFSDVYALEYKPLVEDLYTAQKMMNQNGRSVFSFGGTTVSAE